MTETDRSDSTSDSRIVPKLLDYLATIAPETAAFAQLLIDDGGAVRSAWGPEQMAVWDLVIRRGNWLVRFHCERGIADQVAVARATNPLPRFDDYGPIGLAIFVWARAARKPFRLSIPVDFDHDLVDYGRAALDWLDEGHEETLQRVSRVYRESLNGNYRLDADAHPALQLATIAAMEAAVAG